MQGVIGVDSNHRLVCFLQRDEEPRHDYRCEAETGKSVAASQLLSVTVDEIDMACVRAGECRDRAPFAVTQNLLQSRRGDDEKGLRDGG